MLPVKTENAYFTAVKSNLKPGIRGQTIYGKKILAPFPAEIDAPWR